jgi:hypothetical protein
MIDLHKQEIIFVLGKVNNLTGLNFMDSQVIGRIEADTNPINHPVIRQKANRSLAFYPFGRFTVAFSSGHHPNSPLK